MRKTMAAFAGLVAVSALVVWATPGVARGPSLEGKFNVKVRLDGSDDPRIIKPGVTSDATFKISCADSACSSLTVAERFGSDEPREVTLTKYGSGYLGTRGPYPVDCGPGANATGSTDYQVTPTKTKHGQVIKFSGSEYSSIQGCDQFSYYDSSLKGKRK
jgi:hypothetical protein